MSVKQYSVIMFIGTIICWAGWWMVVSTFDPASAGWIGFGLFYASLFLALVGTFALVGLGLRLVLLRHDMILVQATLAFRQAISFALLAIIALFLQSKNLLTWWNGLLLVGALTLIEFMIVSMKRERRD